MVKKHKRIIGTQIKYLYEFVRPWNGLGYGINKFRDKKKLVMICYYQVWMSGHSRSSRSGMGVQQTNKKFNKPNQCMAIGLCTWTIYLYAVNWITDCERVCECGSCASGCRIVQTKINTTRMFFVTKYKWLMKIEQQRNKNGKKKSRKKMRT